MGRKLASREESGYDHNVHGGRSGGGPPGNHVLNPEVGVPVNLSFPTWKDGPLVCRLFPSLDYKEPQTKLLRGRRRPEDGAFTEWMVAVEAAPYIGLKGCDQTTFLLYNPVTDKDNRFKHPYAIFFKACEQASGGARFGNGKKWDSDWNGFMKGAKGEGAAIPESKNMYFGQGCLYANGTKDYTDRPKPMGLGDKDFLSVIQIPLSAGIAIKNLFNVKKDSYEGDPEEDFSAPYKFGDPIGKFLAKKGIVKGGKIIRIYNPAITKIPVAPNNSWSGPKKEGEAKRFGYEVELLSEYESNGKTFSPTLDAEDTKKVFDTAQFWWDDKKSGDKGLLLFAPFEQQALWIARAFRSAPRLVSWAWSDNPEFLTEEVKAVLAARVGAVVPGSGDSDDDDQDEDEDKPKGKTKKTDPTVKAGKKKDADEDDDDDDDEEVKPKKKGKKTDDEDEDDSDKKKGKKSKKKDEEEDEEEDEDDDEDEEEEEDEDEDDDEDDGDDEDDDEEEVKPKKKEEKKAPKKEEKAPKKEEKKPKAKEEKKPKDKEEKTKKAPPKDDYDVDDEEDDEDDKGTKTSLKAADKAKDRSSKRNTPEKEAPKPPTSKGGKANKK